MERDCRINVTSLNGWQTQNVLHGKFLWNKGDGGSVAMYVEVKDAPIRITPAHFERLAQSGSKNWRRNIKVLTESGTYQPVGSVVGAQLTAQEHTALTRDLLVRGTFATEKAVRDAYPSASAPVPDGGTPPTSLLRCFLAYREQPDSAYTLWQVVKLEGVSASLVHILDSRVRAEVADIASLPPARILRVTHIPCEFLFGPPDVVTDEGPEGEGADARDTYNRRRNGMHHQGSLNAVAAGASAGARARPARPVVSRHNTSGGDMQDGGDGDGQPQNHPYKFRYLVGEALRGELGELQLELARRLEGMVEVEKEAALDALGSSTMRVRKHPCPSRGPRGGYLTYEVALRGASCIQRSRPKAITWLLREAASPGTGGGSGGSRRRGGVVGGVRDVSPTSPARRQQLSDSSSGTPATSLSLSGVSDGDSDEVQAGVSEGGGEDEQKGGEDDCGGEVDDGEVEESAGYSEEESSEDGSGMDKAGTTGADAMEVEGLVGAEGPRISARRRRGRKRARGHASMAQLLGMPDVRGTAARQHEDGDEEEDVGGGGYGPTSPVRASAALMCALSPDGPSGTPCDAGEGHNEHSAVAEVDIRPCSPGTVCRKRVCVNREPRASHDETLQQAGEELGARTGAASAEGAGVQALAALASGVLALEAVGEGDQSKGYAVYDAVVTATTAPAGAPTPLCLVGPAGIKAVGVTLSTQGPISPVVTLAFEDEDEHEDGDKEEEGEQGQGQEEEEEEEDRQPIASPRTPATGTPLPANLAATDTAPSRARPAAGGVPFMPLLPSGHRLGASLALQQLRGSVRAARTSSGHMLHARHQRTSAHPTQVAAAAAAAVKMEPLQRGAAGLPISTAVPPASPQVSQLVRAVEAAVTALSQLLDGSDLEQDQWDTVTRLLDAGSTHPALCSTLSLPAAGVSRPMPQQQQGAGSQAHDTAPALLGTEQATAGPPARQPPVTSQLGQARLSLVQQRMQLLQRKAGMVRLGSPSSVSAVPPPAPYTGNDCWQEGMPSAVSTPSATLPDTGTDGGAGQGQVQGISHQPLIAWGNAALPMPIPVIKGTHNSCVGAQHSLVEGGCAVGHRSSSSNINSGSNTTIGMLLRSLTDARCFDCSVARYGQIVGAVFKLGRLAGHLAAMDLQQQQLAAQQLLLLQQQQEWEVAGAMCH